MHERRIPEWLRHAPTPGVRGFAVLNGIDSIARGVLISVFPLVMFRSLGDVALVSSVYFVVGLMSLATGLLVPWITRLIPRRFVYSAGATLYATGALTAMTGSPAAAVAGLAMTTMGTVTTFVCFNAYVLDYIAKFDLGRSETSRMFYSAAGWTVGPLLGVTLHGLWAPAPFIVSIAASLTMQGLFWWMRLGNGRLIVKSTAPPVNPLAFLPRFTAQPRLVAGWMFAVLRSCGWWVYIVYLPIFAIQSGLGDRLGGIMLSLTNCALFLTPFMLPWMQRRTLRAVVRTGFAVSGLMFVSAALVSGVPWLAVACLMTGSFFMILLDISAGLPFLLAVKPSERTEMSAIYSTYRDVSGILTPGAAWVVLSVAPLAGIFAAAGVGLLVCWGVAGRLHPRLGRRRVVLPCNAAPCNCRPKCNVGGAG